MRHTAALVLLVVAPLAFAIEAQLALGRLLTFGAPALALLAARAACVVLGATAGRLLLRGDDEGWRLARAWAAIAAVLLVVTFSTPYFPSNRTPREKRVALTTWLVVYAVWIGVATRQRHTAETDARG